MKLQGKWNTIQAVVIFTCLFFILCPVLFISTLQRRWHILGLKVNRVWARLFFWLMRLPIQVISDSTLRKDQPYIICANHFSYLDIATMGMVPVPFKFIGKNAMNRIPLFGYMYRKLHITVNRTSIRSRAESLKQARTAIEDGYSVVFFPEGGMITTNPPMMVPFKEGAFRLSAIMNIPILPVVLPDNYKCMPDDPSLRIFRRPLRIKLLRPVWPSSAEVNEETRRLKQEIFDLLQAELKAEKQE